VTVTLSVAMMAHPKRRAQAEAICERLDRETPIVWDQRNNRWDTGRRAMLAYDPACTHHAVIQDDVLVCRDLFAGLVKALENVPADVPVCGYVGRVRPQLEMVTACSERAAETGAAWVTMHTLNWGPLVAVPTDCIDEMVAHCDTLRDVPNYDRRMSRYFELERGIRTWYTWPSLVDHADGPSLVQGRIGTDRTKARYCRVAFNSIGEDASALDVDWSGPVVDAARVHEPDYIVVFRHRATGQELRLLPTSPRVRRLRGVKAWERVKG